MSVTQSKDDADSLVPFFNCQSEIRDTTSDFDKSARNFACTIEIDSRNSIAFERRDIAVPGCKRFRWS